MSRRAASGRTSGHNSAAAAVVTRPDQADQPDRQAEPDAAQEYQGQSRYSWHASKTDAEDAPTSYRCHHATAPPPQPHAQPPANNAPAPPTPRQPNPTHWPEHQRRNEQ